MRKRLRVVTLLLLLAGASASCKPSRAQTRDPRGESHESARSDGGSQVAPPGGHGGHAGEPRTETPAGFAAVSVDPARAAAMGLTTMAVGERDFVKQLRTTGIVVVDETRTTHVHSKVRGWVDGISVNYVGQKVAAGQLLCGIYSQEVYAAEMEYLALLGRARVDSLGRGEFADQERRAREELVAAARRRLGLWDVPKSEIERLETSHEPRRTFPLVAPRAGIVVSKQVLDGTYVDPSTELYTVSDLSRVWLLADVYEADVGAVRVGQAARLDVQGLSGPIEAKVAFLPPTIDEPTRTLKVRFELANKEGKLRPGAFATVSMELPLGRGLAIPESAVVRTGARAIVFVVHDGQHVVPREITLGPLVESFYRVDGGLSQGDVVATGAQFLLDSETRLRASSGPGASHGGH
ncbi:MAG: efflux RND transporter periplasmic adaptor subunit [Deltaproteobacteria bacterium]|nr:efflux RND transporter periplasmic adaptor subunit [Deltaproteobacteria bacterium]